MKQPALLLLSALFVVTPRFAEAQNLRGSNVALGIRHRAADSSQVSRLEVGVAGLTDTLRGVQLSAVMNGATRRMAGVQVAGLSNILNSGRGVQIAGLTNIALGPLRGTQLSAVSNIADEISLGMQLSPFVNVAAHSMRGLQVGGYNYADTLSGTQIGVVNVAHRHPRGVQIGVINYTRDTVAHKIGLVNVNPKTKIDMLAYLGTTTKFNFGLRFRNRSTYNIIGVGTHYMGLDKRFSGALFYRIGQYFHLSRRWTVSGDVGFYHVETFQQNAITAPERLYSLQGRLNLDYQIGPTLGTFASLGFATTRHYGSHRNFRTRPLIEAGLSVRYPHYRERADWMDERPLQKQVEDADSSDFAFNDPAFCRKRYWKAAAEATGINLLVHGFDRFVMDEEFAQVNFKTIAHNWRHGFVWDNDQFSTNLFAHPYHGNLYFNAARSNGLTFWESAPYALGGSLMWEFCGEIEPPAINDLMATTCGGIAIGEMMHRVSALVLNDRSRGMRRFLREAAATVINPMQGFGRILSGDAWRVKTHHHLYHDPVEFPVDFSMTLGTRYLADDGGVFRGEWNPYVNFFLDYGEPIDAEHNHPYDYFSLEATFGLSRNQPLINALHLLGRLWSAPTYEGKKASISFGIYQYFNYYDSKPVKNGTSLTPYRISEAAAFGPGVIFSFPQAGSIRRLEQRILLSGILLGGTKSDYYNIIDRDYNMGSGFSLKTKTHMELRNFGRFIVHMNYFRLFTWKGYEGKDLATVNPLYLNSQGDRGNAQLLVINPLWEFDFRGPLSVVASGSYFVRNTHYRYHDDVKAQTFEMRLGLTYHF